MTRSLRRLSAFAMTAVAVAVHVPGAGAAGLSENFDGVTPPTLPAGWQNISQGTNAKLWGTTATTPLSAPNAAFVNDPAGTGCNQPIPAAAIADEYLYSPGVSPSTAATLTFRNNFNTEAGPAEAYDGGVLEISVNGAPPQDITAAGGVFRAGGYNRTIKTGFGSPISGRQAWSGNSGGYTVTTVDLPASLAGSTVRFAWRLGADCSVAGVGWWIDDVLFGRGPVATTDLAGALSTSGAVLNGSVTPGDFAAPYHFEYGPTTAYGSSTADTVVGSSTSPQPVSATVSGLDPNATYHFRIVTANPLRTTAGEDQTFTTASNPPPEIPPGNNPPPGNNQDTTAPETTIDALTQNKRKTKATFSFSSNEAGSAFECSVDGADFLACVSPFKAKGLKKGKHTFAVRAKDAAGNVDGSPDTATDKVKVKKKRKRRH